jgi:hypothetical protein
MKKYLFLLIVPIVFFSCDPHEVVSPENTNELLGVWINPQYNNDGLMTLDKADEFVDGYGIAFHENGTLTERKNVGWCGTPPITYGDFAGSWEEADDIIDMVVDFWGGENEITWKIIFVDDQTLIIEVLD